MDATAKKLKPEDLQIGMTVTGEQLSDIYGTWIYFDPEKYTPGRGTILYFCTDQSRDDKKIQEIENKYKVVRVYYAPSYYAEDEAVYD